MSKNFKFVNNGALRAFQALPRAIQRQFGSDLNAVQQGEDPFSLFTDISGSVGPGAIELKENGSPAYRAVYCAKYLDTVYVLHAFAKTANGVDRAAMATAKARYKAMMVEVDAARKTASKATKAAIKKRGK